VFPGAGSTVRIGGNYLITNSPDVLFEIHGARSQYRRSDQYKALRMDPTRGNVFSELDETKHMELRTKMAAGVSALCHDFLVPRNAKEDASTIWIVLRKGKCIP
jgi:hypothetical protein